MLDRPSVAIDLESRRISRSVDAIFAHLLRSPGDSRDRLFEAMRHAAIGGGKRLRPLLAVAAARLFAIDERRAVRVGDPAFDDWDALTRWLEAHPAHLAAYEAAIADEEWAEAALTRAGGSRSGNA